MAEEITRTRKKWGGEAIDAGFTIIPNHLLGINEFLAPEKRLSPTEIVVLLQLLTAWWSAERMPFPSKNSIAKRTALSPRQVQRSLTGLEEKGFISRIARFTPDRGRLSNVYDLEGTVMRVSAVATEYPAAYRESRSGNQKKENPGG